METGPTPRAAPSWGQGDRGREGPRRPGGAGPGAGLLTGPTKPSSPVRVKGLSETGAPAAVSGAVCVERGAVRLWLADGHPTRPRTRGAGCGSGGDHPPHLPRGGGRPGPRRMRVRAPHSAPRPWPSVWVLTAPRPLQYTERWPQPHHGCGRLTANDLAEKPPRRSARGGLTGRRRHRPGRRSS